LLRWLFAFSVSTRRAGRLYDMEGGLTISVATMPGSSVKTRSVGYSGEKEVISIARYRCIQRMNRTRELTEIKELHVSLVGQLGARIRRHTWHDHARQSAVYGYNCADWFAWIWLAANEAHSGVVEAQDVDFLRIASGNHARYTSECFSPTYINLPPLRHIILMRFQRIV
jgi:hypothetical protein